jgi:FkbM family methyltransferase
VIEQFVHQVKNFSRIHPTTCLEIGALDGEYSQMLADSFGLDAANLYLVEPNPDSYTKLVKNFPRSKVLPFAVSNRAGKAAFQVVRSEERSKVGCSSLSTRIDGWAQFLTRISVEVECVTGQYLLECTTHEIDLCIVDVEGLTYEVLSSFGEDLRRIGSLLVECEHAEIFSGQKLYEDVARLLKDLGFHQMAFQYAYANQSDSVWIRDDLVDLDFRMGR